MKNNSNINEVKYSINKKDPYTQLHNNFKVSYKIVRTLC